VSPEADLLIEQAIAAFVIATSEFDFATAERAVTVAVAANTLVEPDWEDA
jgi:hypothetical protein